MTEARAETKPLPTGQHEFEIPVVEVKKTLPASGDKKAATVLKLGLIAPDGGKGYAEFFCPDGTTPPAEGHKETLILTDDPKWGMKAARPGKGGGGRGGGRQKTPEEVAAERASIEAQVCLKAAVEVVQGDVGELERAAKKAAEALNAAREILR